MYLEVASHATALADSAGSPPDFPTEPLPVPGSPVLPVEALPPRPLPIRKRSRFSQTATPEPDAKPHSQHIHRVQIGDRSPILDRSVVACRAEGQRPASNVASYGFPNAWMIVPLAARQVIVVHDRPFPPPRGTMTTITLLTGRVVTFAAGAMLWL